MNKNMTICECCDYLANMTDDKQMLEAIDYIQKKATIMNKKLIERKEENEKLDYLYHKSLDDFIKQFGELQKHKKLLNKACDLLQEALFQDQNIFDDILNNNDYYWITEKYEWICLLERLIKYE